MQKYFSKFTAVSGSILLVTILASAHPGHAPGDVVAQLSEPLAGTDHLMAFVVLASVLLGALALMLRRPASTKQKARE